MKYFLYALVIISFLCANINDIMSQTPESDPDSLAPESKAMPAYMTKSPSGALLRSFAVPGWGQLYVESYWKAPLFFGGAATLVYFIFSNHAEFSDYNDLYNRHEDKNSNDALIIRNKKEYYRDNRDMSAFYLLGVYALAAVDAYVGAHLYDFSVEDDFLMYMSNKHNGIAINFRYRLK